MISFVYRAWEKYRHHVQYASPRRDADGEARPDRFTARILGLIGLGTAGMLPALGESPLPLLRVCGLLSARSRSAVGLEGLLRERFEGIPVRIDAFKLRRVRIAEEQTNRLGGRASRLGVDLVLGESVLDRGGAFEVDLGPLSVADFRGFLPGAGRFDQLVRATRFYVTDPLDFTVNLHLAPGEAPPLALAPEQELPLGRLSWLSPGPALRGEVRFTTERENPTRRP
jgi:type VI secretion system protein ImpH